MLNEHVLDFLPGYALGSLDEDELVQVARHLPHCAFCRNELETYFSVVDSLAMAVPLRTPPDRLKRNILRKVDVQAKRAPTGGFFERLRAFFARPTGWGFAGLGLLVLLLAFSNLFLWRQFADMRASQENAEMQIVELGGTTSAPEAQGYLMVFAGKNYGTLVVENAPELVPGTEYQLWLVADGERSSGGVFRVSRHGYGALVVYADRPLTDYMSFGVTVEPEGGSHYPTGDRVLGGTKTEY